MMILVAHGGVGAPAEWNDGTEKAVTRGAEALEKTGNPLEAVVKTVVSLESDGRFNAGNGSSIRLDGKTVEMDAAVMSATGLLGAVTLLRGFAHPVLVAREVANTHHHILGGEGAFQFARSRGFQPNHRPSSSARQRFKKIQAVQKDYEQYWNFPDKVGSLYSSDTVGAVVWDGKDGLAVATSTGGSGAMLLGRVGDTPLIGSGFYAGAAGAVATTGIGEEIMKKVLAKWVYDRLLAGASPQQACQEGVALFPDTVPIGIIAASPHGYGVFQNREMPFSVISA